MNRFFRTLIVGLAVCLLVFPALAKGSSDAKGGQPGGGNVKLRVGVLAAMTALPVVDIVNNGLDKKNGFEVELVTFPTGAPMNEAMAAGAIDASFIGAAAVFALANSDAKMISEICNDTIAIDLVARPDSRIAKESGLNPNYPNILGSAASVKKSMVLCPAGTLSQYEVSKYLSVFGLTLDDVQFVPMDYAQAYQAFKTGRGDILATRSPQSFSAVEAEGWKTIASLTDLYSSATAQIIVRSQTYSAKFNTLVNLVKLVHESNKKLNSDINYAADLMTAWFEKNGQKIDPLIAKKQLGARPFYSPEDVRKRDFGKDFRETLVDFMLKSNQLEANKKDVVFANIKEDVIKAAGLK